MFLRPKVSNRIYKECKIMSFTFNPKRLLPLLSGLTLILLIVFAWGSVPSGKGAEIPEGTVFSSLQEAEVPEGATEVVEAQESSSTKPEIVEFKYSNRLPSISEEELARREKMLTEEVNQMEIVPYSGEIAVGPDGGETTVAADIEAPGDFEFWRKTTLAPTTGSSDINEPSLAVGGKYVFYTGNWYAARSTNGGSSWTYVDPYADMTDFCCDQDTIYDKSRDIFIWYRQGIKNASNVNRFRLGVSTNGGATWCFWNWYPTNFNSSWTNQWWDYPHLALSNDYLYFTSNMFASSYTRSVLGRASLDTLRSCGSLSFTYWTTTGGTWTPVQGARETMYLGRTSTSSTFSVWAQPESSTTLSGYNRTIPSWTTGGMICTLPNGNNPCARSDNRVQSGWVAKNVIGFFWNVAAGSGFSYPYVNAATFSTSSISYIGRPYIWSGSYAWHYAAAYPNERGDLAIATFLMGGGYYPRVYVGIDDDFNGAPPGWEVAYDSGSTTGPGSNTWGDYLRVRPHAPGSLGWVSSGYISTTGGISQPRFSIFGRERDLWSVQRWWDQP
jgi:hypothetical protein